MELSVLNKDGKETGRKASLSADVFGIEPKQHVVWLDVKHYLANQRQGTHKAKQRAEIARSTKKIVRQKGSGGARHGSMKSPTYVGGGRVFGPQPRDYDFKLNKKVKTLARKSVLSARAAENNITVVENFSFDAPKTKAYIQFLNAISVADSKTLFIIEAQDNNVYLSSRNVPKAKVLSADQINTYELINADKLIISEGALSKIESILN
jgi:large subunit ribosomal protein L4